MLDRRKFLGITASAGATMALTPALLRALQVHQPSGMLIERAIPSSGQMLPVVGLSFSNHALCTDSAALKAVLKTFADNGGRVFDAMHGDVIAEQLHAMFANQLGIQNKLFWSTRGTPPGGGGPTGPGAVPAHVEMWKAKIKAPRMDLVMLPAAADPAQLAALKAEQKAGRVRYIGVQVIADQQYAQLEAVMRNEPIDFIGVDYDIANRAHVEDTILPLAQERKIGVMAFFPFGNNGGVSCGSGSNLFGRVGNRPLPEWAAEFDAKTWSHFFLKYVLSHPAVTVARVGTTKAHHMLDNMGGGIGRLPDESTRQRMAALIDALPPVTVQAAQAPPVPHVLSAAILDRYVGKYKTADGRAVDVRRYGSTLVAKSGPDPDTVLRARSATRFSLGSSLGFLEFQPDSAGAVNSLVYEQGGQKIAASRIR